MYGPGILLRLHPRCLDNALSSAETIRLETIGCKAVNGLSSIPVGSTVAVLKKLNCCNFVISLYHAVGWIANDMVDTTKEIKVSPKMLFGKWIFEHSTITTKESHGKHLVEGHTSFNNADNTISRSDFDEEIKLEHGTTIFKKDQSTPRGISLILIENQIIALDLKRNCDGTNANFEGPYNKKRLKFFT